MVLNYSHRFDEALQQLATWYITGQLKVSTSNCLSRGELCQKEYLEDHFLKHWSITGHVTNIVVY